MVSHHGGSPHVHVEDTSIAGAYSIGFQIEGIDFPGEPRGAHDHGAGRQDSGEPFTRLLSTSIGFPAARVKSRAKAVTRKPAQAGRRRSKRSSRRS